MPCSNSFKAQAGKHIKTTCTDSRGLPLDPVQMLIEYMTGLLANLGANLKPNFVIGSVLGAGGAEIAGATVTITDGKTIVASATTDITGFYVFPKTSALEIGRNYQRYKSPRPKATRVRRLARRRSNGEGLQSRCKPSRRSDCSRAPL